MDGCAERQFQQEDQVTRDSDGGHLRAHKDSQELMRSRGQKYENKERIGMQKDPGDVRLSVWRNCKITKQEVVREQ